MTFGSLHVVGPAPFVQPRPVVLPEALSHPPAYHAHDTPFADSSSPMVTWSCRGSLAPNAPNGFWLGCMVFTAKSPHTRAGAGHEPSGLGSTVSTPSRRPVDGCSG